MEQSRSNMQRHDHTGNLIVKYKGYKITNLQVYKQSFRRNFDKY